MKKNVIIFALCIAGVLFSCSTDTEENTETLKPIGFKFEKQAGDNFKVSSNQLSKIDFLSGTNVISLSTSATVVNKTTDLFTAANNQMNLELFAPHGQHATIAIFDSSIVNKASSKTNGPERKRQENEPATDARLC